MPLREYHTGTKIIKRNGFPFRRFLGGITRFLATFCIFLNSYAQPREIKFDHLTTNEGLSQSFITCIGQDKQGFMWFGTEVGLNKFDGYQFIVYRNDPRDSTSLSHNEVWALLIDSKGQLWVGTTKGLDRLDQERNVFIHYKNLSAGKSITALNLLKTISEDSAGNIWVGTQNGIGLVDQQKQVFSIHQNSSQAMKVSSILEDSHGNFWAGSLVTGLVLFDREKETFQTNPIEHEKTSTNFPEANPDGILLRDQINWIYEDSHNELWIATNDGLYRHDKEKELLIRYFHQAGNENTIANDKIHCLAEDAEGNLWIGHHAGISILDKSRTQFSHHHYSLDNPDGLNNNYISYIYRDKSGNLWLGSRNSGLNIYYNSGNNFRHYAHQANNPKSLNNNIVKAVLKDKKGRVWIGTDGGGLNRLLKDGSFISYQHDPKNPKSLPNNLILALYEDRQENLWVSTFEGALSVMDRERKGDFNHLFPSFGDNTTLSSASVSVMYEDRKDNFWVGTWYGGLHLLDRAAKKFYRYKHSVSDSTGLSSEKVLDITEDESGKLWIGTGNGLNLFDPASKKFTHYFHDKTNKNSISNNVCNSICANKNGQFWIGTNTGLNLLDSRKGNFTVFGLKDGFANDVIQGVLRDDDANLWISTLNGITRFNPQTKQLRNYGIADGLQGGEYITHSYFKSADGEMFFGGNNGLNAIDPRLLKANTLVPPVVLTDLKVFNRSVRVGQSDILNKYITYSQEIELSHRESVFSIEFAALNYTNPENNQYAYKLEGFDPDWNYIGNQRSATYTNLDPGEYNFRVKASNNDGLWNEQGAALKITVIPPYYETPWFRAFVIVFLLGIAFLIYFIRISSIKKQKKELEWLVLQRTKEILAQKEEIETQKESIEEKNLTLEKQFEEITTQNEQIMIQNDQLEETRKEVKEKNDQLEEYNTTLEHVVKERTKQLTQTNKELDQFVYRSAHDLQGPITRIMGLCNLGTLETADQKTKHLFNLMDRCTKEMSDKLSRLMTIHSINTRDVTLESIDFKDIVSEVTREVFTEQNCNDIKVMTQVENSVTYTSDKFMLKKLLKNIIENAVKFKDMRKATPYIKITVNRKKTGTKILIADNGLGIPQGQEHRVFDMFVVSHESIKGFGLGLYEARLIARKLNGNIKLINSENGDTEFRIVLNTSTRI